MEYNKVPQLCITDGRRTTVDNEAESALPPPRSSSRSDDFADQPSTIMKCVRGDEIQDDISDALPFNATRCPHAWSKFKCILTTNLVDDDVVLRLYRHLCGAGDGIDIDDGGLVMVKIVKLWALSLLGICLVHPLARWMVSSHSKVWCLLMFLVSSATFTESNNSATQNWEIDENYTLQDFIQYDFSVVLLDLLFFFFVGRLYNPYCRGIDRLFPWGIFMGSGAVYPSIANYFDFLRHSISMYEIHCRWPVS